MLALITENPVTAAFCAGAFLCGVAVFHTVMMRTYRKRQDEHTDEA